MEKEEQYYIIDWIKFIFAILIVLLHINFPSNLVVEITQQYISRLGVPFFFVCSGFFLSRQISNGNNEKIILKKFLKRTLTIFIFWMIIYSPYNLVVLFKSNKSIIQTLIIYIQQILFKSPSYLWYLVAVITASVPFCFMYRKKLNLLFFISIILYIIGTLGNSYSNILPKYFDSYYEIFLTTRNGIFFALIFLCIGGFICNRKQKNIVMNKQILITIFIYMIFCLEVYFVQHNMIGVQDYSMYFSLPILMFYFFELIVKYNNSNQLSLNTKFVRKSSLIIYTSQFGFILIYTYLLNFISIQNIGLLIWILTILSACTLTLIIIKINNKFLNKLT